MSSITSTPFGHLALRIPREREVGLPSAEIPLAPCSFNAGIELGQLAFIACVVAAGVALRRLAIAWPRWATAVPAHAIGSLAIYWCSSASRASHDPSVSSGPAPSCG